MADRPNRLEGAPLTQAPTNELGVVFLFAHLAKRWRLRIESIRSAYPDCIAYQQGPRGQKRVRIEFEYRSRNFAQHRHQAAKCDWVVCWEDNWPNKPKSLRIVELRQEFGLGFNVWVVPCKVEWEEELASGRRLSRWSVPSGAHKGDLVLYYVGRPVSAIKYVFRLQDDPRPYTANWRKGRDYMAPVMKVATLASPLFLQDLKNDRVLRTAGVVRAGMQWRANVTSYWAHLHSALVARNPALRKLLAADAPGRLP